MEVVNVVKMFTGFFKSRKASEWIEFVILLCDQIPQILSPFPSVPFVISVIPAFWIVSVRSAGLALNRKSTCFSSAWHVKENGHGALRQPNPACCRTVRSVLPSSATQKSVTQKAQ